MGRNITGILSMLLVDNLIPISLQLYAIHIWADTILYSYLVTITYPASVVRYVSFARVYGMCQSYGVVNALT
ncbi:hypothetical protein BGW80DRAFT_1276224 [Lactifluus volemus]|nr:hypothetical protein BGW80DRAFT_1276224 [Lactifluus volemus]